MTEVTGLYYFDGGVLSTEPALQHEYNALTIYQDSELPGLGVVLQGCTWLTPASHECFATLRNIDTGNVVFTNKLMEITTRRTLDPTYTNDDPVLVWMREREDLSAVGTYRLQFKAVRNVTGVAYFAPITIKVVDIVSGT